MNSLLDGFKKPFQTPEEKALNAGDPVLSYGLLAVLLFVLR